MQHEEEQRERDHKHLNTMNANDVRHYGTYMPTVHMGSTTRGPGPGGKNSARAPRAYLHTRRHIAI